MAITELIKRRDDNTENELLVAEMRRLNEALENAYDRFELLSESDLIEATIYEIEALKARYRYLLSVAKEKNLKSSEVMRYGS